MIDRPRILRAARTVWLGAVFFSAGYFFLICVTTLLLRHAQALHLNGVFVGRVFLPPAYRPGWTAVRADVLVADIVHSLLSGQVGGFVMDALAVFWTASAFGAAALLVLRRIRVAARLRSSSVAPPVPGTFRPAAVVGAVRRVVRPGKILEFRRR